MTGAALRIQNASPVISECTLYGNDAGAGYGTIHCMNATPTVENSIVAFATGGIAISCYDGSSIPSLSCCNLYGNADGDWTGEIAGQLGTFDNISADPLFCDAENEDFTLEDGSPCAPANSPCGRMGSKPVACATYVEPTAACCVDGSCTIMTEAECLAQGGDWYPGAFTCEPNPCPRVAVCCAADESCTLVTHVECVNSGGDWHGNWSVCSPNPCYTAAQAVCCTGIGVCGVSTQFECQNAGGTWYPAGESCDPNPCTEPGVCCTGSVCHVTTELICEAMTGEWYAEYESCDPNPCPPSGACCVAYECYIFTESECEEVSGQWHGGYGCAGHNCAYLRACCVTQVCYLAWADECQALGGLFKPNVYECDPNPCPTPVSNQTWGRIKALYRGTAR
jgi:hypothetical protein